MHVLRLSLTGRRRRSSCNCCYFTFGITLLSYKSDTKFAAGATDKIYVYVYGVHIGREPRIYTTEEKKIILFCELHGGNSFRYTCK